MQLKKTLLTIGIVTALGAAGNAMAQDAQPAQQAPAKAKAGDLDTITVTGIRGSQEKSLDTKRNAKSHIEVVTAEDVGKLPAHNVADTLQRLPGVNISSSGSDEGGFDEADRVSLRGTSPSLTQTMIDGHSVASADWFVLQQGGSMGRSVSYTLLPSELVYSVEVNKTSQAKLVDGGTTGTVNIITRKPLQFRKGVTGEGSIGAVYSDQAKKYDPQFSALFNYKNNAGNFGIMVQAFSQKRHLLREAQEVPGGFAQISPTSAVATAHPDLANVYYPSLLGSTLFDQVRDRRGGLVSIQVKTTDSFTLGVNAFVSNMKADNYNRNYMLWGGNFANTQSPDAGYVVQNGVLTKANYTGQAGTAYAVYDMISREATAKTGYFTIDGDWQASENLSAKFQLGSSWGQGETARQFIAEVTSAIGGGASWNTHGNSAPADWSVGGYTGPAATGFGTWGNQQVKAIDREKWATLDFTRYFNAGAFTSLDFGARMAYHSRRATSPEGASPGNIAAALANAPVDYYPSGFASNIGGSFPRNIWFYTPDALKNAIINNSTWLSDNDGPNGRHNYGGEFTVREKSTAAYVQANFEGAHWNGNFGLRSVNINQGINTYFADTVNPDVSSLFGAWKRVYQNNKINRILPSANFKYDLTSNLVLRLAGSQTQTLPDYSALGASSWGSDLNKTGGGGNPKLKPVLSTNFDANLEWYFMPRGLLSAGVYSMDMKDYVAYGVQTQMLFSELTHQLEAYQVSMPINSNAKVKGVELVYEQPIGKNFGVNANYTYADGSSSFTWADGSHNLLGTSKNTYNIGGYFENDTFGARVSYTRRSSFLIGLSGAHPYYQASFGTLSASLSYKATKWLSVSLDALNLNDPVIKYYQSATIPTSFYSNGRQYYLNLHFKF